MPQTTQMSRGQTSISINNLNGGESTLLTIPSCIACRVITSMVSCYSNNTNSNSHQISLNQIDTFGYKFPLGWIDRNLSTGLLSFVTSDDAGGFPSVAANNSAFSNGVYATGTNISSFNDANNLSIGTAQNGVTLAVPRNFWMGPGESLSVRWRSNGNYTGTIAYSFILVLYS